MSIKDVEKSNSRQIESLRRSLNREVERLEEGHTQNKVEIKKGHSEDLVNIQHENMRQLANESEKKEKVLGQMKTHLDETQKLTDKEISQFKTQAQNIKSAEAEKLKNERERVKAENDLYLEDMGYRFSREHKKIVQDNQNQAQTLKDMKQAELTQNQEHYQDRINAQTSDFTTRFTNDTRNYQKMKADQDKEFKTTRANTNLRQQVEMAKLTNVHNDTMELKDTDFRKGLKSQDLQLEKKYAETLKIHSDNFKRLEEKNVRAIDTLKDAFQEQLKTSVARSDDPFYNFTELKPEMKQLEDRIEIRVAVPDHSKQDIQLTMNNKEAILTYNRRYDDTKKMDGVTNKLHKVESFTTRMATKYHLDPKSVKSSYENGVMTYVIKHA